MDVLFGVVSTVLFFLTIILFFVWLLDDNDLKGYFPLISGILMVMAICGCEYINKIPPEKPVVIEQFVIIKGEKEINGSIIKADKYPVKISTISTRWPFRADSPVIETRIENIDTMNVESTGTSETLIKIIK